MQRDARQCADTVADTGARVVDGPRVLVIACGALAHELVRIKAANDWSFMDFQCLPAELHNEPQKIPAAVQQKIRANRAHYAHIVVAYADCGTGGLLDAVLAEEGVARLPGAHCYEFFCGGTAFAKLHAAELGSFYLTDFLATHFQRLIVIGLGLDRFPELKTQYFQHYRKLVWLAQTDDPIIEQKARAAASYLDLTYEKVLTGDHPLTAALAVRVDSFRPAA